MILILKDQIFIFVHSLSYHKFIFGKIHNHQERIFYSMSGGELFEKVSDEKNRMSETDAVGYIRQVCEALCHMHEMNYVHLDLKPENIMFITKKSNQLKLIDFGLAAKLDPKQIVKVTTGTAEFAAPEVVVSEPVGFYTDMWSVGVLTYILQVFFSVN